MFGGSLDTVMDGYLAMVTIYTVTLTAPGVTRVQPCGTRDRRSSRTRAGDVYQPLRLVRQLPGVLASSCGLLLVLDWRRIRRGSAAGEPAYILDAKEAHLAYAPMSWAAWVAPPVRLLPRAIA